MAFYGAPCVGEGPEGQQFWAIAMIATSAGHQNHKEVPHDLI